MNAGFIEAMKIDQFDCVIFHADPKGSRSGLNSVAILCLWKGSKKLFHKKGSEIIKIASAEPMNVQLRPAKPQLIFYQSDISYYILLSSFNDVVMFFVERR